MAETVFVKGRAVSHDVSEWQMEEREGTTRKVWVSRGKGSPTEVRFKDDAEGVALFEQVMGAGEFAGIEAACEASVNVNDRGQATLTIRCTELLVLATIEGVNMLAPVKSAEEAA